MRRALHEPLRKDLATKVILLCGPRQVGKTTLAKSLSDSYEYLNYDAAADRVRLLREQWDREKDIWIFDELHKLKSWKRWLKGVIDTERRNRVIVTGSAKLDTFRKVGDSMAGRYFRYSLFPLDLKELSQALPRFDARRSLDALLELGGFPEPYLSGSRSFYNKWKKTHLDVIVRQDLAETERVRRIFDIETLVELMTERAGTVFSYNSVREDLRTDDKTVKRWMLHLESAYVLFKLNPYAKAIKYALHKSPKYYFFDVPRCTDEGARFENLVALSLLKEIHFRNEALGEDYSLSYLRDKAGNEIDFLILKGKTPIAMIEAKLSDDTPSPAFSKFELQLRAGRNSGTIRKVQLVRNLRRSFSTRDGIEVLKAEDWLPRLDF